MYLTLVILAAFVFFYSITAGRVEKMPISGPIIFVVFGLLVGPSGFGLLDLHIHSEELSVLAELKLALVLFTDAAGSNFVILKNSLHIPLRLLLIGLPLTLLLGYLAGTFVLPDLPLLELALLATMLAPTDAALGKAVVSNESVPPRIRTGLNVESGLNDGICVPVLFVFLALVVGTEADGGPFSLAFTLVVEELGIGALVGIGCTAFGTWIAHYCNKQGWITKTWSQLPLVALAMTCFALAQLLHGSGFIACFIGGMLFGAIEKTHKERLLVDAEGIGDTLALITWVVFGAVVVGPTLHAFSWEVVCYAILSLTVVRMLPVFLCLAGTGLSVAEKLFIGWFGPRGLASIVFAIIVLSEEKVIHGKLLALIVACTVILSVLGHGFSANPLANRLGKNIKPEKS